MDLMMSQELFTHLRARFIRNATQELSKLENGATEAHWHQLWRAIKYKQSTKDETKLIDTLFNLEGISDSSFEGKKDSCISLFGYFL